MFPTPLLYIKYLMRYSCSNKLLIILCVKLTIFNPTYLKNYDSNKKYAKDLTYDRKTLGLKRYFVALSF